MELLSYIMLSNMIISKYEEENNLMDGKENLSCLFNIGMMLFIFFGAKSYFPGRVVSAGSNVGQALTVLCLA